MVKFTKGNLLEADVEALVNSVNCVGVMGKGIALQFKRAFPKNFRAYQKACRQQEVQPGQMFIVETGSMLNPRYIINFPTKRHWREKSRIEDIEAGLGALVADVRRLGIRSIAIPPLGSGLGGLDWRHVRPKIEAAFADLSDVRTVIYEPLGVPAPVVMPVAALRPHMTAARAQLILLMAQYAELAYRLTLLEIQKLAYFLQETGEPLRLRYEKGHYGPYAHNLTKVLELLEGHFISGHGDAQKPDVEIKLQAGAFQEAGLFLQDNPESLHRLEQVANIIEGYETPYGMELLASVHWLGVHDDPAAKTPEEAVEGIQRWNSRKRKMFQPRHVHLAWDRLSESRML